MKSYLPSKRGGKLHDDEIVAILCALEDDARDYVHGPLADAREVAMREYYQQPYADDDLDDGLSKFVTSEVQDTIEWILPSLIKMFMAGENAVEFEPRMADDEDGAMQATECCNYVFYVQNNGMLTLMTAFKDALMLRGGPIHWYWEEEEITDRERFKALTEPEIAYILQAKQQEGEAEITGAEQVSADVYGMMGELVDTARYDIEVSVTKKRGKVTIDAFPPENLLVARNWHSPLLDKCPYVNRREEVSLSRLREKGYDVTLEDLGNEHELSQDRIVRDQLSGDESEFDTSRPDQAMQTGWLSHEWVLIDADGDGIAERRRIVRLGKRILENERADHVPIANGIPILRQHRWDGLSLADAMSDLQKLKTELTRMTLNSAYFSVLPQTQVLTDGNGVPQANVDDILSPTPGGMIRMKIAGAAMPYERQFVGQQVLPLIQYVDGMKENRSGVGQYFTGSTENALNKTASGTNQLVTQAQQRVEMIARMLAETCVKPMFKGIFRLLSNHQVEPMMFRLRGKYVEFDPQEWRDQYDMIVNVGLGNNNKDQTLMHLQTLGGILQTSAGVMGQNGPMVKPRNMFEIAKRMAVNMGFKQYEAFVSDPGDPAPPQPPAPPPEIVKTQMTIQGDAQEQDKDIQFQLEKLRQEQAFEAQKIMAQQQAGIQGKVVDANLRGQSEQIKDERGFQREQFNRQQDMQMQDVQSAQQSDGMAQALQAIAQALQALAKPRRMKLIRDASGRAIGAEDDAEPSEAQPNPAG